MLTADARGICRSISSCSGDLDLDFRFRMKPKIDGLAGLVDFGRRSSRGGEGGASSTACREAERPLLVLWNSPRGVGDRWLLCRFEPLPSLVGFSASDFAFASLDRTERRRRDDVTVTEAGSSRPVSSRPSIPRSIFCGGVSLPAPLAASSRCDSIFLANLLSAFCMSFSLFR